jgi:hypothetical protein
VVAGDGEVFMQLRGRERVMRAAPLEAMPSGGGSHQERG